MAYSCGISGAPPVNLTKELYPCTYAMTAEMRNQEAYNIQVLGVLSIVSSFLSLFGSGSIILYASLKRICKSAEVRPLFHLSIADFFLALFWMTGAIINFSGPIKDPMESAVFCFSLQAITETVHLMSFFLTVNYAASVYYSVKERINRVTMLEYPFMDKPKEPLARRVIFPLAYVFAWTLPIFLFIPFGIMLRENKIMACQKCIILLDVPKPKGMASIWPYYGYIVLVVALCISILLIMMFYFLTLQMYRRALPCFCTDRQRMIISSMTSRVTLYILVFLYCWSPAFIIVATRVDLDRHSDQDTVPLVQYFGLYVLQAISAPLQGLLNSIVYGWSRRAFREAVGPEGHRFVSDSYPFRYGAADSTPPSSLSTSIEYSVSKSGEGRTLNSLRI